MQMVRIAGLGLGIALTIVRSANAAVPDIQIGAAAKVINSVYGAPESTKQSIWLRQGTNVFHNEDIITGDNSASQMIFRDDSQISIGAGSYVKLDKFVYDPNPNFGAVTMSFMRGAFRFVSGHSAKINYDLHTPAATIGVRGTAFTVLILPNGNEFISVESGMIYVTCHQGETRVIRAGEMTFIRSPTAAPSAARPAVPMPAINQMDALLRH